MSLRINTTGIRSGETIEAIGKQAKGTRMIIRGFYPPSIPWVQSLDQEIIRDQFNNYKFFRSMSPEQRLK